MGSLYLVLTIFSETAAIIFMKFSDGFVQRSWAIAAVVAYFLSFIFLTLALKLIPAGITNAIWAGSSTVLVAVLGVFIFKEQLGIGQVVCLGLIVAGLIGLNFVKAA